MKKLSKEQQIEWMSQNIVERALLRESGSACLVPSGTKAGKTYAVKVDPDFNPVYCPCHDHDKAGHYCKHMIAVDRYYAERRAILCNDELNPVVKLIRANRWAYVRQSHMSKEERRAAEAVLNKLYA